MGEATIPVDLRNPGQVFACLGLMEAAAVILETTCEGCFNYESLETNTTFSVRVVGCSNPVEAVLEFLRKAEAIVLMPTGTSLSVETWKMKSGPAALKISPSPVPESPATLPVALVAGNVRLVIDHWADGPGSGRDNLKFWAGSGGQPGAALARAALELISTIPANQLDQASAEPFSAGGVMTSSFRFDWRGDYIPIDAGFSPNRVRSISMVGYPITELLAAYGMQNARPTRIKRADKLKYRYGVSSSVLPTSLARVVLGAVDIGFPMRTFRMVLGWPGKKGQARCIVDAQEEFSHDRA
jgi:CRISPR-associated protein Csb3